MDKETITELNEIRAIAKETTLYEIESLEYRIKVVKKVLNSKEDLVPHYAEIIELRNSALNLCYHYNRISGIDGIKRRLIE